MSIDPIALEQLSRDALIAMAGQLGAKRPELLTRPELRDEIIRLSETDAEARKRARGWFGVARDLVASVVAQGLSLPDTADLIRGVNVRIPKSGPPVATVTLAEIYAAQGHVSKALKLLDEVLAKEPDHEAARVARERYAPTAIHDTPRMPPEPEEELAEAPLVGTEEEFVASGSVATASPSEQGDTQSDTSCDFACEESPTSPSARLPMGSEVVESEVAEKNSTEAIGLAAAGPARDVAPQPFPEQNWALLVVRASYSPLFVWHVASSVYGRLSQEERATLSVRVLEVASGWDGPVGSESFIPVNAAHGRIELVVGSGVLRVAIGIRRGDKFSPLGVAAQFAIGSDFDILPVWLPPLRKSIDDWTALVRPIAEQLAPTLGVK